MKANYYVRGRLGSCPYVAMGGKKISHQYVKYGQQMIFFKSIDTHTQTFT